MFLNFQFSKFKKFVLLPLKTQRSGSKAVCCFSIILILKVMMKVKESKSQKVEQKIEKQPPEVFCKKDVLRNFVKFTGKHLCQSLFFNKVAGGAEHVWATAS